MDPHRLAPLRLAIPTKAEVVWMDCGEVNGYYHPPTRRVIMCNELSTLPRGVLRFVYAHELAHAFIHENGIPYTGSEEWAADELASLVLIEGGWSKDVEEAAKYQLARGQPDRWSSEHPGDERRAAYMLCMAKQGAEGLTADFCYINYPRIKAAWKKLYGLALQR